METIRGLNWLVVGTLAIFTGCEQGGKAPSAADYAQHQTPKGDASLIQEETARRMAFTADNNPTTRDQRGEPSLDDFRRPAAWVYIDGQEGRFIERDGQPQVQWQIERTTGSSPTFRVEVYEPLLGTPTDFVCTLDTVEAADGSKVAYGIKATEGTFVVGREYSLLYPGDSFVVRNRMTGDVVNKLAPLAPGTYLLAAGVKNRETNTEGLAITRFTVGEDDED